MPYKRFALSTNMENIGFESFNRAGKTFVFTEMDLAITFCQLSLLAHDPSKVIDGIRNARRAFRVASQKRKEIVLNEDERRELGERVSRLRTLLREVALRKSPHIQQEALAK